MGTDRSKQRGGSFDPYGDLETFRERILDHPDESVADIENSSHATTGPVRVIVKQDGVGRTGGIVIGIVAGLALGMAVLDTITGSRDYHELEREVRLQQLKMDEYRMALMKAGIDPNPHLEGESK